MPGYLLLAGMLATVLGSRGAAQTGDPTPESSVDVRISLDGAPSMGDPEARVAVVEFADYQCPYCRGHAIYTLPEIIAHYVITGKIRYFFKDLPVESSHAGAFKVAEAARCAGEQVKYWEMHDHLMRNPTFVSELPKYALDLNLSVPEFQLCLDSGMVAAKIRADIQESKQAGVRGTPSFFVGALDSQSTSMHAVTMIYGAQPYAIFRDVLDRMIASDEKGGSEANARP